MSDRSAPHVTMSIVYVKSNCPHSTGLVAEMRAAGEQPIVIDVDRERHAIPELFKLSGGRRIVPVRVSGTRIFVAPSSGTKF